jgi:hypothetical protein
MAPGGSAALHADRGVAERLRRLWVKCIASGRYDRLEGGLRVARDEIGRRICEDARRRWSPYGGATDGAACWARTARALLEQAEEALDRAQIDQGWRLLHAARRAEILALDRDELAQRAIVLRAEAEKLRSWRQKAVHGLLGTAEKPEADVGATAVVEAATVRDEHYDNQAYKDQLLRTQMLVLVLVLVAVLTPLLWTLICTGGDAGQAGVASFGLIELFGLLGATVSGMLRASDSGPSARIPELTAAIRVTFMRILMGGASAVVVYVFFRSGLGSSLARSLFSDDIAQALGELQPYTTYAIAFVSGFSERFVLRAVEAVAGKAEDKTGK